MVDFENTQPESLDELPAGAFKIKVFVGAAQAKARVAMKFSMSMQRHGANAQYIQMTRRGRNALDMHIAYFLGQLLAVEPDAVIYIVSKDKDYDPLIEFLDEHGGRCTRVKSIAELKTKPAPSRPVQAAKQPAARTRPPAPATKPSSPGAKPGPGAKPRVPAAGKPAPPKPAAWKPAPPAAARAPAPASAPAQKKPAPDDFDSIVRQLRSMTGGKPGTRKSLAHAIAAYFRHHGGARGDKAIEQAIEELQRRGLISLNGTKVSYNLGA
jgi:hypothetical protein